MYSRIVVPLDGSALASEALGFARLLGRPFESRLTLVEVIPPVPQALPERVDPWVTAAAAPWTGRHGAALADLDVEQTALLQERARNAAHQRLEHAAAPLARDGFRVECHVVEDDDAAQGITNEALTEPDTLVAMATHGRGGIGRWMLGSVTDQVLRHTEQPIAVVRAHGAPRRTQRIRKVVLPLDGSKLSEGALPHAVAIARALDVPITVIRSMPIWEYRYAVDVDLPQPARQLGEELNREIKAYVAEAAERLRGLGVSSVEEVVGVARPDRSILEAAGDAAEALVVMSSHGYGGVKRWVLGSVTDHVVRSSPGPVLVVRPAGG